VPTTCLELRSLSGTYLVNIPTDPRFGTGSTGLDRTAGGQTVDAETAYVVRTNNNRVTVEACRPEQESAISVTR